MKLTKDFYSGAFFFLAALAIWFLIPSQIPTTNTNTLNGQFFPKIISIILGLSSGIQIMFELKKQKKEDPVILRDELKVLFLFLILLAYIFAFSHLGFLIPSLVFGPLILLFFGQRRISYYIAVETTAVAVFLVFTYFLRVQLG